MIFRRSTALLLAALIAGAIVVAAGSALADYMTGETYQKFKPAYQLGYAIGAVDMMTHLQAAGSLQPGTLNDQIAKIAKCLLDNKVTQSRVGALYLTYLSSDAKAREEPAALSVFEALKIACKIDVGAPGSSGPAPRH